MPVDGNARVTLKDDLPNSELDLVTQCGHGFVSAIVTGVQLTAAIDTSTVDSKGASELSGSLKFKALNGLISGKGSAKGITEEHGYLKESNVALFVVGGERYSIPRDIEELSEFVHNLPNLADKHPRPIRFAVTLYSALTPTGAEGTVNPFEDASLLQPLAYAYFALREARDRVADALSAWDTASKTELFLIPNKLDLFERYHTLTRRMANVQEYMRLCRSELSKQNAKVAGDAQAALSKQENKHQVLKIYEKLLRTAQARRIEELKASITSLQMKNRDSVATRDVAAPEDGKPSPPNGMRNGSTSSSCAGNENILELISEASEHYFFSFVSIPINLSNMDDSASTMANLMNHVTALLKDEGDLLLKRNELEVDIRKKTASCRLPYEQSIERFSRKYNRLPPQQLETSEPRAGLRRAIEDTRRQMEDECAKVVVQEEADLKELNDKLSELENIEFDLQKLKTVVDVLAHEVYRMRFFPRFSSMCEIDSNYHVCSLTYPAVIQAIGEHIVLGKTQLQQIEGILSTKGKRSPIPPL